MTRREIEGRYRGSFVGISWSFVTPLLMLIMYTAVFSGVFNARWGQATDQSHSDYAVILFAGLLTHGILAECLGKAPALILSNTNLVKKVIFPLEVLPWVTVTAALFHGLISLSVLAVGVMVLGNGLSVAVLALPLVLLPLMLLAIAATWFFSAMGVFLRDIDQLMGMAVTMLLFLSPVFYPVTAVPESFQPVLQANPLSIIIESMRAVMVFGQWPDFLALLELTSFSLLTAWAGFVWFQKTRRGFADVL